MKNRYVSAVVSAALLLSALLACKTSEEDVKKLESIKTAACACSDKACADTQLGEFKTLVQKIKNKGVSEDHKNRITEATKDLTICLMKQGESIADIKAATE
jgi:hypothetical protein